MGDINFYFRKELTNKIKELAKRKSYYKCGKGKSKSDDLKLIFEDLKNEINKDIDFITFDSLEKINNLKFKTETDKFNIKDTNLKLIKKNTIPITCKLEIKSKNNKTTTLKDFDRITLLLGEVLLRIENKFLEEDIYLNDYIIESLSNFSEENSEEIVINNKKYIKNTENIKCFLKLKDYYFYYCFKKNEEFKFEEIKKIEDNYAKLFSEINFIKNENKNIYILNSEGVSINYISNGKDLTKFLNTVSKIRDENKDLELFFRGQANSFWKVQAGIFRSGFYKNEKQIYASILSKLPFAFRNNDSYEQLLTIQHYGGPTKLIDVTQNPLISLFFACFDEYGENLNKDGIIFIFKEKITEIKYFWDKDIQKIVSLETEEKSEDENKSFIIKGIMLNDRIKNQDGDFIISNREFDILDKYQKNKALEIIIIDSKLKNDILNNLDYLNINEGTVYPEIDKKIKCIKKRWNKQ